MEWVRQRERHLRRFGQHWPGIAQFPIEVHVRGHLLEQSRAARLAGGGDRHEDGQSFGREAAEMGEDFAEEALDLGVGDILIVEEVREPEDGQGGPAARVGIGKRDDAAVELMAGECAGEVDAGEDGARGQAVMLDEPGEGVEVKAVVADDDAQPPAARSPESQSLDDRRMAPRTADGDEPGGRQQLRREQVGWGLDRRSVVVVGHATVIAHPFCRVYGARPPFAHYSCAISLISCSLVCALLVALPGILAR